MFKKILLACLFVLSLNCSEPANQFPYIVFRDIGKSENNQDPNPYMQDRSCAFVEYEHAFFGVFDGHGTTLNGHIISDFVSKNIYQNIISSGSMSSGFAAMDYQLKNSRETKSFVNAQGSTASVVLLKDNKIHIGHVGDSKIVLVRGDKVIELTHDHTSEKNDKNEEYIRIKKLSEFQNDKIKVYKDGAGKWYMRNSQKNLGMTRAFGDRNLRPYVISEPELLSIDITDEDEFLVLATDGLWDTIIRWNENKTREEQLSHVLERLKSQDNWQDGAQALFQYAQDLWLTSENGSDNIEIVVVNLKELFNFQKFKKQKLIKEYKEAYNLNDEIC